jgi:hypothetical protein
MEWADCSSHLVKSCPPEVAVAVPCGAGEVVRPDLSIPEGCLPPGSSTSDDTSPSCCTVQQINEACSPSFASFLPSHVSSSPAHDADSAPPGGRQRRIVGSESKPHPIPAYLSASGWSAWCSHGLMANPVRMTNLCAPAMRLLLALLGGSRSPHCQRRAAAARCLDQWTCPGDPALLQPVWRQRPPPNHASPGCCL